jgi:hypothetical protein
MAAPYVSGVVALVAGLHPSDTAAQLVQLVESTTKPLAGLSGKTATGGMVDAARAVGLSHIGLTTSLRVHSGNVAPPASFSPAVTASVPYGPRRHSQVRQHRPQVASLLQAPLDSPRVRAGRGQRFHAGWPNSWV